MTSAPPMAALPSGLAAPLHGVPTTDVLADLKRNNTARTTRPSMQ
jgi:hypothetical protein